MDEKQYNNSVERNYKWNFIWMMVDNSMFFFIFMGLSPYTILPLYINHFTESSVLIGLIPTIYLVGATLPQLFMANFLRKTNFRKKYLLIAAVIQRVGIFGLLLLSIFQPKLGISTNTTLILFFLLFALQHFSSGFYVPVWIDFVGKSIPRKRGLLFGLSNFVGGLMGIGIGWLLSYLLSRYLITEAIPLIFGMSFIASMVSLLAIFLWREVVPPETYFENEEVKGNSFKVALADKNFLNFLIWRVLMVFLEIATPFYSLSALKLPGSSPAQAGIFTTILSLFQTIINPLWGWLGDRKGFLNVVKISCLAGIMAAMLAVVNPSLTSYYFIYAFLGIMLSGISISNFNIIYDFSPKQLVYLYLAVSQVSLTPLSSLVPLLGGVVADNFGFAANYWIAAGMGAVSLAGMMLSVKDPFKLNKASHVDQAFENTTV